MSVNKIILIGNVGQKPETRTFENGGKIAKFTLATTKRAVKKQDGTEIPERTDWHNVIVQGGLVDVCEKYVDKGSRLYVEGEIRYRQYEKDGQKKSITEVCCHQLELLTPKNSTMQGQAADEEEAPF